MRYNSRKLAVLSALRKLARQTDTVTMPELMQKLGSLFVERSVRRWLNELMREGQVEKSGQKRGTRYRIIIKTIPTLNKENKENKFAFSAVAQKAVQAIEKPVIKRKPIGYDASWVDAYKPNHTFYLSAKNKGILKSLGNPELDKMPAGTYARKIYNRLLIDLSYNSSRLEGNTYSLGETEKLIMEGVGAVGKLDPEKIMILNHKEAIRYLVENATKLVINFNTICTLHYLLSDGLVSANEAGKIRDHSVKIGSSTYIPMDGRVRLTKQLNHICSIAEKIDDPYEQSFFLLVQIAYLQAFVDVNKRTARLSANIPLITHNLYPISFNKIEKDDYISAMIAIYELHDPRALAELYTFSSMYTAQEYDVLKHAIGFNEARIRFRNEIRKIMRDIIVKKLTGKAMQKYIENAAHKNIPVAFQLECINAINEDLSYIGPERIHGLGISQKELSTWVRMK